MVGAIRSFENIDEDNVEERLQSDACELGFQHMTYTDIFNAAAKQKCDQEGGNDESEICTVMNSLNSS
jgi:hypothetical protein